MANRSKGRKLWYNRSGCGKGELVKVKNTVCWIYIASVFIGTCKLEQVRFFVSGENLLSWHNYSGLDPEIVDVRTGFDKGTNYPLARKFTLGLTVKF